MKIIIEKDEEQNLVVAYDDEGIAHGRGINLYHALNDWKLSVSALVIDLHLNPPLHPRMQRQLEILNSFLQAEII